MRIFNQLLLITFSILTHSMAMANVSFAPERHKVGFLSTDILVEYFKTEANFDSSGGSFTDLANGRYYSLLNSELTAHYWWSTLLETSAALGFALANSNDSQFERNNSQLTEGSFATRYWMRRSPLSLIPELEFIFPLNTFNDSTDEVLTGEGVIALQPGIWLLKNFNLTSIYAFVGFKYQTEGRAGLLPYRLGAHSRGHGLLWGGELNGYEALLDDEYANTPATRTVVTNRVDGGSLKFYAVNPRLMSLRAWSGWRGPGFGLKVGAEYTLDGANAAQGITYFAQLQWEGSTEATDEAPDTKINDSQFEPEKDNYDPTLFEETPAKKSKLKQKKKKSIDQMLDETQKSLEP